MKKSNVMSFFAGMFGSFLITVIIDSFNNIDQFLGSFYKGMF